MRTVALILGACLVSGATAVRLRNAPATEANTTVRFTSENVTNAFKIVGFLNRCKINPGSPLPTGGFPTKDDFSPDAFADSACGKVLEGMPERASPPQPLPSSKTLTLMMMLIDKLIPLDKPDYAAAYKTMTCTDVCKTRSKIGLCTATEKKCKTDAVNFSEVWEKNLDAQFSPTVRTRLNAQDVKVEIEHWFDVNGDLFINATEFETQGKKLAEMSALKRQLSSGATDNSVGAATASVTGSVSFMKRTEDKKQFTSSDVKNAFKIVAFMKAGCKNGQPTLGSTGVPDNIPTINDFDEDALKTGPCGGDGMSGSFDTAGDSPTVEIIKEDDSEKDEEPKK